MVHTEEKYTIKEDTLVERAPTKNKKRKKKFIFILILLCIIIGGFFLYNKKTKTAQYLEKKNAKENTALVSKVSKIIVLPEGTPAIFDVQDPDVLKKDQAFFNGAQKGDKLIIYAEASKAILYSPSRNIILNVGPVTFDQNTTDKK